MINKLITQRMKIILPVLLLTALVILSIDITPETKRVEIEIDASTENK
jgi:hypothetical protein